MITLRHRQVDAHSATTTACSCCHFTGGHVPCGTPMYQSPDKYAGLPYFRPLGYNRDLEDSIIDCFRNGMNTARTPTKNDPVMRDMVVRWEGHMAPRQNLSHRDKPAKSA